MKYLFIVQGEGRGHLTQAIALSELLRRNGHQVVEVLLGDSKEREIPDFFKEKIGSPILQFATFTFKYKKNKKQVNLFQSILYNAEIKQLAKYKKTIEFIYERICETRPDAIIGFYEIMASLTQLRYKLKIPFINIGHQFLLNHSDYKFGIEHKHELMLLRLHTIVIGKGATKNLALSFYPMQEDKEEKIIVVPPLLRKEILELKPTEDDYILVYMLNPGYEDEIREWHKKNPKVRLYCFWDKKGAPAEWRIDDYLRFFTINDKKFIHYMAGCKGYISTAGFESICEAFYLKKPVMVIPAHVEQEVNAADAASTGYGITGDKFNLDKLIDYIEIYKKPDDTFKNWVDSAEETFLRELTTFQEQK